MAYSQFRQAGSMAVYHINYDSTPWSGALDWIFFVPGSEFELLALCAPHMNLLESHIMFEPVGPQPTVEEPSSNHDSTQIELLQDSREADIHDDAEGVIDLLRCL
jgi:hypothetical protein